MKPSEILYRAIEVLDERGWCRGKFVDDKGRCCGSEAIIQVGQFGANYLVAYLAVAKEVGGLITGFNDNVARDKRHVQQKMRKAAKALEAEGR